MVPKRGNKGGNKEHNSQVASRVPQEPQNESKLMPKSVKIEAQKWLLLVLILCKLSCMLFQVGASEAKRSEAVLMHLLLHELKLSALLIQASQSLQK